MKRVISVDRRFAVLYYLRVILYNLKVIVHLFESLFIRFAYLGMIKSANFTKNKFSLC